jgi:methylisocitrate lyase
MSTGKLFRQLVNQHKPLQVVGAVNAYSALMAEKLGHKAIYLSGSGVATASHGLPDLGITSMNDVVEDAKRITSISKLPLLVDIDVGFGGTFNIARTIKELERVGVAAVHIEDQISAKRCGHRPGKEIVSQEEMVDRIKSAANARVDPNFVIMARTDSLANEGIDSALRRCKAYIAAGADMLFPEACNTLEEYKKFAALNVPILANITEFGKTPLFTRDQLNSVGVGIILYPLSAHRAMAKAATLVYEAILKDGTQKNVLPLMQTREELYQMINYYDYEKKLDDLNKK